MILNYKSSTLLCIRSHRWLALIIYITAGVKLDSVPCPGERQVHSTSVDSNNRDDILRRIFLDSEHTQNPDDTSTTSWYKTTHHFMVSKPSQWHSTSWCYSQHTCTGGYRNISRCKSLQILATPATEQLNGTETVDIWYTIFFIIH